jgi:predicted MPP superfamily phosphohydrolase
VGIEVEPAGHRGRGTSYSRLRGAVEWSLCRAYGRGWPARLSRALGFQRRIRTLEYDLPLNGWPRAAPPLKVAFASDFHAGPTTHPKMLELACQALAAAKPDLLLLGGDFVFLHARHVDALAKMLGEIRAPAGRYAVLGNHDLWADDRHITDTLAAAGIEVLINRAVRLPPPFDCAALVGLDDAWTGTPDAESAFRGVGAPVRILLMHAPSGLLAAGHHRFDVALCGHTHGGHLALPGGIPIVTPGPLSRRYSHGAHRVGPSERSVLLVSRGVGEIEVPLRLFADPDVVVCTLHPASLTVSA